MVESPIDRLPGLRPDRRASDAVADLEGQLHPRLVPPADEPAAPVLAQEPLDPLDRRHRRAPERVAVEVDEAGVGAREPLAVVGEAVGAVHPPGEREVRVEGHRASRSSVGTTHAVASHSGRSSRSAGGGPGTKVAMPSATLAARPRVGDRGEQVVGAEAGRREQGELVGVHAERLVAVAEVGAVEHRPAGVDGTAAGCRARARSRASSCRTRSRRASRSSAAPSPPPARRARRRPAR